MYGIRENLYKDMISLFEKLNILNVYLFGSLAMGNYKNTSDIDFAVEFSNNDEDNYIKLYTKLEELNTLYKFDLIINSIESRGYKIKGLTSVINESN